MSQSNCVPLRATLFNKMTAYTKKAGELGYRVRERVFGFRLRSTLPIDRCSLPVKLEQDHRLRQRQRVFQQAGGSHSSVALHALNKARQRQRP